MIGTVTMGDKQRRVRHARPSTLAYLLAVEPGGLWIDGTSDTVSGATMVNPNEPWPSFYDQEEIAGHPVPLTDCVRSQSTTYGP